MTASGPGHKTKIAAMPIYGKKNLRNLLFWNPWTNFNETWYVALGTLAHHSLYKPLPCIDLDLFYGKVKYGHIGFSMGKKWKI